MSQLRIGDAVEALNAKQEIVMSDVAFFLDRKPTARTEFVKISYTHEGYIRNLEITEAHLIYVKNNTTSNFKQASTVFAGEVKPGDEVSFPMTSH